MGVPQIGALQLGVSIWASHFWQLSSGYRFTTLFKGDIDLEPYNNKGYTLNHIRASDFRAYLT